MPTTLEQTNIQISKTPKVFYYLIVIINIIGVASPYIYYHLWSLSGGSINPITLEANQPIDHTKSLVGVITNFFSNGSVSTILVFFTLGIGLISLIKYKHKTWGWVLITTSVIYFLSHCLALFIVLNGLA